MSTLATSHLPADQRPRTPAPRSARAQALLALGLFETRKMLTHPIVLAAVVLYVVPWIYGTVTGSASYVYPVLQDADRATQFGAMVLLGSAALLTANMAVLRPARYRTATQVDVLLVPAWERAAAVLLAVSALGGLTALLAAARAVMLVTAPGAAGSLNLYEVATGPVVVILMGAGGVLTGVVIRSTSAAPFVLVLVVAATLATVRIASPSRWLLPVVVEPPGALPMPAGLLVRPAGAHLLYLTAVIALLAGVVLIRAGNRAIGAILALAAAAVGAVAVPGQLRSTDASTIAAQQTATVSPAAMQKCQRIGTMTYCFFAGFEPWVEDWNTVVTAVVRRTPEHPAISVRQRVFIYGRPAGNGLVPQAPLAAWAQDDQRAGTPGSLTAGTSWGQGEPELELAAEVAHRIVTGTQQQSGIMPVCGSQAVLTLWLAGQSSPRALEALKRAAGNGSGAVVLTPASFGTGLAMQHRDALVALDVLGRSVASSAATVQQHWQELTAARTTTEQAAKILGYTATVAPAAEGGRCA